MAEVRGRVVVHARGFGFLEVEGQAGTSAFITPPDLNPFLEGDLVAAHLEQADGRFNATRLRLVERSRTELFGSVVTHGRRLFLRTDRFVSNTDWPLEAAPDDPLLQPDGPAPVLLVAELRDAVVVPRRRVTSLDEGLERVAVRHGLRTVFADATVAESEQARLPELGTRRDLRALPTVTIDAPTSRDLDDALAVLPAPEDGGLRLLVSIADVAALVPEGSALDEEARRRATSVYLAGRVLPMLPPTLSEDALSLLPERDRPALTVELRIDPEGHVTSVDLYESSIRSHARLSYAQVAEFLETDAVGSIPESVLPTLRWLRTAAARISAQRSARGGVEIVREEAYVSWDEASGQPTQIDARPSTRAHALVERLMVAANEAVARWLFERGLPGLYRVHETPSAESVRSLSEFAANFGFEAGFGSVMTPRTLAALEAQFKDSALAPAMYTVLGRVLGPARYTVHPQPHFGLAAPLYLHFTSPIRRYADLTVHRIVKGYLAGRRDRFAGEPELESLAQHINRAAYRATKAEAERLRALSARLFRSRIGERFAGRVVRIQPFGLIVQLESTGVAGTVAIEALPGGPYRFDRAGQTLHGSAGSHRIGDAIEVKVAGVNEELGRIELGVE